jgi:hypothetical protein
MNILNFAHPFTEAQLVQIRDLLPEQPLALQVFHLPAHFDAQTPYLPQVQLLLSKIPLSPDDLQTAAIIINLPSFSAIAALVLAELHGRLGYFPPVLRLRPVEGALPPRFEVAEILNLQDVRDAARAKR